MKIPGLDEIMSNMEKFAEMHQPLEEMNYNLRTLAMFTIENSDASPEVKEYYINSLR